jgi:hypothetical protein
VVSRLRSDARRFAHTSGALRFEDSADLLSDLPRTTGIPFVGLGQSSQCHTRAGGESKSGLSLKMCRDSCGCAGTGEKHRATHRAIELPKWCFLVHFLAISNTGKQAQKNAESLLESAFYGSKPARKRWWAELDSNQRRRKPADLQNLYLVVYQSFAYIHMLGFSRYFHFRLSLWEQV